MHKLLAKFPPSVVALVLQALALSSVLFFTRTLSVQLHPLILSALCGGLAAVLSQFAGLARWWLLIQFLFTPALLVMLSLNLPPNFFLVAFLMLLVIYWSTFRTQVPLYLSSRRIWQALELLLPCPSPGRHFTFMDLGSGIGGVLTHLASARADGHFFGVEAAPLPFLLSWLRIRLGGYRNCRVHWGSLWNCNLADYDVVFAYLSPVPMEELWQKARQEMRPGTVFISNTFAVHHQPPQQTFTVDDLHHSTLYIWHM
jgi:hypothetical protein